MNVNDNVLMEYEARVMLSEKEYLLLKEDLFKNITHFKSFINKNIYFDNKDLYLTHHHMALRLRSIDNKDHELTLKVKGEFGDKEITQVVNPNTFDIKTIKFKELPLNPKTLDKVGELITERIEIKYQNYLLVLDKNIYNSKIDYNLEIESSSREKAEAYLLEIIKPYHIKYKKDYVSKSRRAILKL